MHYLKNEVLKILFVINPKSGAHQKIKVFDIIENHARLFKYEMIYYLMKDANHDKEILNLIQLHQPKIVTAIGGDGTVNLIANLIKKKEISLLIIPYGSANGMAKELGIPTDIIDCLNLINIGKIVAIDLIEINHKICVHLADIGFNAKIIRRFESDKNRGFLIYVKYFFLEIFMIKRKEFLIYYEHKIKKVSAIALTFANASKYGLGAIINPDGKLNDGWFEICIVKPFPSWGIFKIAYQMFKGTLKTSTYFEVVKCTHALVSSKRKNMLQIDGEIMGYVKNIELNCSNKALNVIIPSSLHQPTIID
jgi:diacylglycerol kinase (ATP)